MVFAEIREEIPDGKEPLAITKARIAGADGR